MEKRINFLEKGQQAISALYGIGKYLSKSSVNKSLLHLLEFRISQINGCAYCLDMHAKDLRAGGETEQRLYLLDAWRESPFYSASERAALAWAEAITKVPNGLVPDDVYEEATKHFSEQELIDLTMAIVGTNCWNRINIAFGAPVGSYQVGQWKQ